MTPSPITPTPVSPITAVSGGTGDTSVSGLAPVSGYLGPSGTFTGPHFIEEQFLTIDYWRVPSLGFNNLQPTDVSLSAACPVNTVVSGNVNKTKVWARVTATTRITKSYDRFGTSSYQQPQKFQILSTSADENGNTYEAIPTGCLGPAGTIMTSQMYYNRRPWESTDAEIDYTTNAYTYRFNPSSIANNSYEPAYGWAKDYQERIFNKITGSISIEFPELSEGWQGWGSSKPYSRMNEGTLYGPYRAQNEQSVFVEQILDYVGANIANGHGLYSGDLAKTSTSWSEATGQLSEFDTSAGGANPYYLVSRHDYS